MQRLAIILALGAIAGTARPVAAQEAAQVEFVRGLRSHYGPKLADEYLGRLRQQHLLENDPRLRLEAARTRLELAAGETNLAERIRLSQGAQAEIEELLKDARYPDVAAEARVVKLQIANLHGTALLSQALRQEAPGTRQAEALRARAVLAETSGQIQQLFQQIDGELIKKGEPKNAGERQARKALEEARLQAQTDLALNLFDQALTFIDSGNRELDLLRQRGDLLNKAQTMLDRVGAADPRNPICWQARAWGARCSQERDDPRDARKRYEELARETNPAADAGKRLASSFRLLRLLQVMQGRAPAEAGEKPEVEAQRLGEAWRRQYPGHLDTPEGFGVRFALGDAYRREAETGGSLPPARRKELLEKARDLYREVELNDNEFSQAARQQKIKVVLALQGGDPEAIERIDVATLRTFDELYLRAQFEASRLAQDADKYADDSAKLAGQRKVRYGRIVQALNRALELAGKSMGKVPEEDLNGARLMLAYTCLIAGEPMRAVEVGEELARKSAAWSQAPTAAVYALQAYQQALGNPQGSGLREAELPDVRGRLRQLGDYVIKSWPDEMAADVARHELAVLYLQDLKLPEAAELLEEIRPGYHGAILARYQLALTCFQLSDRDQPTPTDKDRRPWPERGLAALEKLPALPTGADASTGRVYLLARLKLGELLYRAKKYVELEKLTKELSDELEGKKVRLSEEDARSLPAGVFSLRLFAGLGRAEQADREGRADEALQALDLTVPLLDRPGYADVLQKNEDLRRGLLELVLRLYMASDDRAAKAAPIVAVIYKLEADAGASGAVESALATVIHRLDELRAKGRKEELGRDERRFESFLNELVKRIGDRSPGFTRLAAEGYSQVGKHDEACKLLQQVTAPSDAAGPVEQKSYRLCRVMLVRERRQAGKLDEAEALLMELHKQAWSADFLEVRMEDLHLLDARGKHNEAFPGWNKLVGRLASGVGQERGRDLYFEAYYNLVESYYRYGQGQEDAKKATVTRKAAAFIADLEGPWPDLGGPASQARFRKLLAQEKPLRDEYERRKGK